MSNKTPLIVLGIIVILAVALALVGRTPSEPAPSDDANTPSEQTPAETSEQAKDPTIGSASSVRAALESEGWSVSEHAEEDIGPVSGDLAGTERVRRWNATRADTKIEPYIEQFRITDPGAFVLAVAELQGKEKTIGQRNGYLIDVPGLVPSTAFVLIGKKTVLFVQYGVRDFGNLAQWGENDPAPELEQIIHLLPLE